MLIRMLLKLTKTATEKSQQKPIQSKILAVILYHFKNYNNNLKHMFCSQIQHKPIDSVNIELLKNSDVQSHS